MPDILLERRDAGRVVLLCGAGVSLRSGMPSFVDLTRHVIDFLDPPEDSEIMAAFQPWLADRSGPKVPLDQIFNLLHQEYGRDAVNSLVTQRLAPSPKAGWVSHEHGLIKRISSSREGTPQIVTTNFDRLFEIGEPDEEIGWHVPPSLPDLALGASMEGITYLHGRLAEADAVDHRYVLSSADFGRAYLSEAWATNFVRNLLDRYTVVLVGYQAEDPPVRYLLQGLKSDGQHGSSRLYAFDKGLPEDIEARWRDRGATAIAYADHSQLWQTMEAWAERADDPRAWRASVISGTRRDPKSMAPHMRGQVAHVLRTVPGARLLSEAGPAVHPEWICVLDGNVRSAKQSSDLVPGTTTFDPRLAYGLDDDLEYITEENGQQGVGNDNLLEWRSGNDTPRDLHRLAGRPPEGHEAAPARLGHLANWIGRSLHSPVLAWWAARQNGLHPRLIQRIDREISRDEHLHGRARHAWNLILEHHRDPRNRPPDDGWYNLEKRVAAEGWTEGVLRDFRRENRPRVEIRPPFGIGGSTPPAKEWDDIRPADDIGRFEVRFSKQGEGDLEVTDGALPEVFRILEDQLAEASGFLSDIGTEHFRIPTCYPGREVDGKTRHSEAAEVITLFIRLFDRITDARPELARAHVVTWPETDRFCFRKLKLYGLSRKHLFDAEHVVETVLSFDQDAFWDMNVARELLFLLVDRWAEFSPNDRVRLTERILEGPDQRDFWPDDESPSMRDRHAACYGRYLQLKGCEVTPDLENRLAGIVASVPDWNDAYATSTVTEQGVHVGWVGIDDTPDVLMHLPVNEITAKAQQSPGREFGSFTEKQPFKGLVKKNPRKALSALTVAGKTGEYLTTLWTSLIVDLPDDIPPRLKQVFLHRLKRLPHDVIAELRHPLGRWLESTLASVLELDEGLAWSVHDHIVDGILSGGEDAAVSGIKILQPGEIIERSRRTLDHAINGPIGMCAEALIKAVPGDTQEAGSLIPAHIRTRLERLLTAPGEGSDHAISVATRRLNWFMHVDPEWTEEWIVPMLAFEHPSSEPAWNGFLHDSQSPSPALVVLVKPLLLKLQPWIDRFAWDRRLSEVAGHWLGSMYIFCPGQPDGLTKQEMRSVLRSMSDDARSRLIFWLGRVGKHNDGDWERLVVPFIDEVWPRESKLRTSLASRSWIGLLDDTGDSFPAVYAAVKRFLTPVEPDGYSFFQFTGEISDEKPIATCFPEETLDLVNSVTPGAVTRPPHELPRILELIAESDPSLASDPRYLRLIDLVDRS